MEVDLDPELRSLVDGGEWQPAHGTTTATTWHVAFDDGRAPLVVKAGTDRWSDDDVVGESARRAWLDARLAEVPELAARLPVPAVRGTQAPLGGRHAALVQDAAEGVAELHWFVEPRRAAELLGSLLRAVHELPVDRCPFDAEPGALLARAEARVAAGAIDPHTFGTAHQRYTPAELLAHAEAMRPSDPMGDDRVVVHGDWSVGNVIARPDTGAVTGIVDWAGMGVGDRHLDLATASRSLVAHFGGEVLPTFLAAYGLDAPDALRLEFSVLLDQLR